MLKDSVEKAGEILVIAKFSRLDIKTMLRVYTVATILMVLTSLCVVYILSKIL